MRIAGQGNHRFRRTRRTGAASALLLGLTVLLAPDGLAQQSEPETGEIRNGRAKAVATIAKYAPGVGSLELGITNGTAVTQVTNQLAQATSQTTDLGLIGTSLTSEGCDGDTYFTAEDLPQPTSVDNRDGDTEASRDESGTDGSPLGAGRMQVEAGEEPPSSRAHTTATAFEVPGALRLGGGDAWAATRVLPGEGREAVATVRSSMTIGDVLELSGMRWHAEHRTGVEPRAEGSFEIGHAEIGGLPFPTDDLESVEAAVNDVLVPSGITVTFPRVRRLLEPSDLIRVTPMRIELRDSPVGKTLLGPALDLTREQRGQLFDSLVEAYCDSASALLVGDIAVSVVSGTGFLTVELGGVQAASSDLEIGNPFGDIPAFTAPPPAAPETAGGAAIGGPSSSGGGLPAPAPPTTVAFRGQEQAVPARATGPVEELCESLHPNGDDCSEGAAATVGVVGLLATVGMAGADVVRQRRRVAAGEV